MCDNWNELSHLACATVYPRLPGVRLPLEIYIEIKKIHIELVYVGLAHARPNYTPGIGKIVPRNVINLNNKRLTTSEWPTKILTTPS